MGNFVWISSYPKSGNTWLRVFLANYISNSSTALPFEQLETYCMGDMNILPYNECLDKDMSKCTMVELKAVRQRVLQYIAERIEGTALIKTHMSYRFPDGTITINRKVTKGAIYIVRNPFDVIISYADHFGISIDQSIEASNSIDHFTPANEHKIPQYLGSWSKHATGWLNSGNLNRLILRYEDVLSDPPRAFKMVTDFMNFEHEHERLMRAIEFSSFKILQKQEQETSFSERSDNSKSFFRQGKAGAWRNILSPDQVDRIIRYHGTAMKSLGYIRNDGSIAA